MSHSFAIDNMTIMSIACQIGEQPWLNQHFYPIPILFKKIKFLLNYMYLLKF